MENAVWLTAVQPLANDCLHANEKKSKKLYVVDYVEGKRRDREAKVAVKK